jgi:glycerol transport system ATP-binding protein
MTLALEGIAQRVGPATHLYPLDLALHPNALTVLLGATRAGKTTLLRIMAGLDQPTSGRIRVDGVDVTGRSVRERNIAMVYQQFINYPSLTVAENIASPLRRQAAGGRGLSDADITARVQAIATRLKIDALLDRLPAQLSGGQQQRVALARALAKRAPLMLLDEPLVNLDYKLRESLRDDLSQLFATGESTVVYATTEPMEALLLGGYTAVLDAGELLQYGPTHEVYHRPQSLRVARAFSDPPMNFLAGRVTDGAVVMADASAWPIHAVAGQLESSGPCTVGLRAGALRLVQRPNDLAIAATVTLADIAGSDTYLHADTALGGLVAQLPGVALLDAGSRVLLYFDPAQLYLFDAAGALQRAPITAGS